MVTVHLHLSQSTHFPECELSPPYHGMVTLHFDPSSCKSIVKNFSNKSLYPNDRATNFTSKHFAFHFDPSQGSTFQDACTFGERSRRLPLAPEQGRQRAVTLNTKAVDTAATLNTKEVDRGTTVNTRGSDGDDNELESFLF